MIYRFTLISNEVEDFVREIKIDAEATFYDFHKAILSSCHYEDNQITSFFICNEEWEQTQEILLEDMGTSPADEDLYLMKKTRLSELLEDEKQRLVYVFDPLDNRMFFIELTEISFGKVQAQPVCSRSHGEAPQQTLDVEEFLNKNKENTKPTEDLNEDFYGSESFDNEEFDPEGFEISDGNPYS
ncbi:MAG: plasmid pRiA4b ORF-3 family protein [Paraprevotella sp.]|nr:plasmid pRiA4b ORF-3 family protein [Paraprevotella sp.]